MRPVLFCLFLTGLCIAGAISASADDCPTCVPQYDDDWFLYPNPYSGCPTCIFAYDDNGLLDPNPYSGCPTCIFAYDDDGLLDPNPYAGCPTCIFAYDDDGLLDPNPYAGCPACSFIFETSIESNLTPLYECTDCRSLSAYVDDDCPSCVASSKVGPGSPVYRFENGTPIPGDYVCPIHGIYCPDDPRPPEYRPGYAEATSKGSPTLPIRSLPETTAEFMSLFNTAASIPKSGRLEGILYRSG